MKVVLVGVSGGEDGSTDCANRQSGVVGRMVANSNPRCDDLFNGCFGFLIRLVRFRARHQGVNDLGKYLLRGEECL